jgi:hypothetical protein
MRKFSELSNTDPKVERSMDKKDYIKNLVEEALSVVDGEIVGKDTLVKTLNKIIEMNDSKTKIQVLESVKVNAYRGGFDFNKISEAIEIEKAKLNAPIEEEKEEEKDIFFAQPNDKIVSVRESVETEEVEEETDEEVVEESVKGDDDEPKDPADECEDDEECDEEDKVEKEEEDEEEDLVEESTETFKLSDGRVLEALEDGTIINKETGEEVSEEDMEDIEIVEESFDDEYEFDEFNDDERMDSEGNTLNDLFQMGEESTIEAADLLADKGSPEWNEIASGDPIDVISKLKELGTEEAEALAKEIEHINDSIGKLQSLTNEKKLEESKKEDEECEECGEEDKEEDCGEPDKDDEEDEEKVKESVEEEITEEETEEEIIEEKLLVKQIRSEDPFSNRYKISDGRTLDINTDGKIKNVDTGEWLTEEELTELSQIESELVNENAVEMISSDYEKEKSELASLYENILVEHHLETKKERIEFILDNEEHDEEEGKERKKELENMSDREIENIYKKIEKDMDID